MRFTKPSKIIGLDIGSHSVKAVQMSRSGAKLRIDNVGYATVDRNQVNVDPVAAHANALHEAMADMPISQCLIVGALPGQTVVIRYPRLRNTAYDQIDAAIEAEAGQNIPYDLSEVFLDWSLLEEEGEGEERQLKVLLVAAKHETIDSRVQIADAADIQFGILSVDSLALADAAEGCALLGPGESVALINVGASSASIHFTRDGVSNFIRDVSWGAREIVQAIAKARGCDFDQAERTLYNVEAELAQEAEQSGQSDEALPSDEAAVEELGAGDELGGDDLGGSLLDPLDDELGGLDSGSSGSSGSLGGGEISEGFGGGGMGAEEPSSLAEILATPISRLVAEIRRSFDYYEHQLYERPVERIILSGGAAHLSLIREALIEDLGVEQVDVADPTAGAIQIPSRIDVAEFSEHPSQFMVAVGLAARGAADL